LDWARFLGPVKWREWDPQQYWSWRAYLDFGGGQIGDLYVHQVDLAHFLLGIDDPVSAVAAGGVLHYKDGRTAPDNIALAVEYANGCVITYEGSVVPGARGRGLLFFGTEGGLRIDSELSGGPLFLPPGRGKPVPVASGTGGDSTADHVRNFLECMRSRKLPVADVYIGHRSSQAALLGKVAYLEQRRVRFDPVREETLPVADSRLPPRAENV
jgi:predicted dehydrogenase